MKGNNLYCKTDLLVKRTLTILLTALLLTGCHQQKSNDEGAIHRGIYHWKSTYNPTEWEKGWMKEHRVDKLYIRLFDIEDGKKAEQPDWRMVPVATTQFLQRLPSDMEVVPVVYITVDAIRSLDEKREHKDEFVKKYAQLIAIRIDDMMSEHYDGTVKEVQLDCDWTQQTERCYFELVKAVKTLLHKHGITLSGTLRLHQLRQVESLDTIPFDRCLLMCYNTGNLQNASTHNSILDFDDVKPYLRQYHSNVLHNTDIALPVYGWGVEFEEDGTFSRLVNSNQLADAIQTSKERKVFIREEWGNPDEIRRTRRALPQLDTAHTIILYHLDSLNLSRYSHDEIEEFYTSQ